MVAIYARTSGDNERKMSIDDQFKKGISFAESIGMPYLLFQDRGISGFKNDRPEFNRMMSQLDDGRIKYLWFLSQDRSWRNTEEALKLYLIVKNKGVKLVVDDKIVDQESSNDLISYVITAIQGEEYVKAASKRNKLSIQNRFPRGGVLGKAPFGFRTNADKKYEIDESQAAVVRLIFKLKIENLSMKKIGDYLNDNQYTPQKHWNYSAVENVLRNHKHYGRFIINEGKKDVVDFINPELAIISKEDFLKAQQALKEGRNWSGTKAVHKIGLLKGLLRCGVCGSRHTRHHRVSPKGADWSHYQCGRKNNGGQCENSKNIREDWLDEHIWSLFKKDNVIKRMVMSASEKSAVKTTIKKAKEEIAKYESLKKEVDKKELKLQRAWFDGGTIKKEMYDQLLKEFKDEYQRYENAILNQENVIQVQSGLLKNSKEILKDINSIMNKMPYEDKIKYIHRYIKEIFVGFNKDENCFLLDVSFTHSSSFYAVKFNKNYKDLVVLHPQEKTDSKMSYLLHQHRSMFFNLKTDDLEFTTN